MSEKWLREGNSVAAFAASVSEENLDEDLKKRVGDAWKDSKGGSEQMRADNDRVYMNKIRGRGAGAGVGMVTGAVSGAVAGTAAGGGLGAVAGTGLGTIGGLEVGDAVGGKIGSAVGHTSNAVRRAARFVKELSKNKHGSKEERAAKRAAIVQSLNKNNSDYNDALKKSMRTKPGSKRNRELLLKRRLLDRQADRRKTVRDSIPE